MGMRHENVTVCDSRGVIYIGREKVYDVRHVRTPDMGYRLQPLWMIQSPHPNGARACEYSLTPIRPDGVEGTPWTGKYTTAAPTADAATPPVAPKTP